MPILCIFAGYGLFFAIGKWRAPGGEPQVKRDRKLFHCRSSSWLSRKSCPDSLVLEATGPRVDHRTGWRGPASPTSGTAQMEQPTIV